MLTREPKAGRGAVDFKIGRGYTESVTVEVKYTSNKRLVHGFTTQLPIYTEAERTGHSIYLVLRTIRSDASIKAVRAARNSRKRSGQRVPDLFLYDARLRRSRTSPNPKITQAAKR